MSIYQIVMLLLIGLSAGMLSGMFGVGGGVIMVPAMVFFAGMTQHGAQGTSLGVLIFPVAAVAAWQYHKAGHLDLKYSLIIGAAFLIGGYFGSKLSIGLSEETLTRSFGVLMLAISVKMIFFPK